ncbi:MAG: KH domain-containing protein [Acidimicrobiia bacterium]|nr:KH domain-containing protein [Acidimicrobiia bacterium]MYD41585.1 KH domain-containing protein [Acidimicrobiia bacterium]
MSLGDAEKVERLVGYLVTEIVERPSDVTVTMVKNRPRRVLAEVRAAKQDMGRLIGRRGRTANAIRTLAQLVCDDDWIVEIEFLD